MTLPSSARVISLVSGTSSRSIVPRRPWRAVLVNPESPRSCSLIAFSPSPSPKPSKSLEKFSKYARASSCVNQYGLQ